MTTYSFGDIILVAFPFTDHTTSKKRPAVVISSDDYQWGRDDIIIMAVTSRGQKPGLVGEAEIKHWRKAGLLKASLFKPVIATIQKKLVLKRLGSVSAHDRQTLANILRDSIGGV